MNNRGPMILAVTFVVVLAGLAGAYLVFRTYAPPASASPQIVPEVRQFSVHMHTVKTGQATMHHWMPSTMVANVGDSIIIKVTNGDPDNAHGFALAALNLVAPSLAPGETQSFRFRVSRPGVYAFQCSLAGCASDHADMVGQLVVLGK